MVLPTLPESSIGGSRSVINVTSDEEALRLAGKEEVLKVKHTFRYLCSGADICQREWSFWAVLGLSSIALSTWEAIGVTFANTYVNGGPVGIVYGFLACFIGELACVFSMAEMASM